ncbi:toxin VasX, partial [Pseudomonas cichorii]
MTAKSATLQQRRAARFDKTPASDTSVCPFKGSDIAIVPVRYALDRSRYDVDPARLTPLPAHGKWSALPALKTRSYTLRQLDDGYVYVFDETAGTLHEYVVSASDTSLKRIVWTEAHRGQDVRTGSGETRPYLLYPRKNHLHLAYSSVQWTWRICEHMRSHAESRARWMKSLDLTRARAEFNKPDTLHLLELATAVADIDQGTAVDDNRFADSAIPVVEEAYWLGSVPDKASSLLIALDDHLRVLNDLGLQLAGDQAALRVWQQEHEHKLQIAQTVTQLCGARTETHPLPAAVRDDSAGTQKYLSDLEAYFEQLDQEEMLLMHGNAQGSSPATLHILQSAEMRRSLQARYGQTPSAEDIKDWQAREKWRREVDLKGARDHLRQHLPTSETLLQQVRDTQADLQTLAEHLGNDPLRLFVDTCNPSNLLYLQTVMTH